MSEIVYRHPRFVHITVLGMFAVGVGYAGNAASGGIDHIRHLWQAAQTTHAGLDNIDLNGDKAAYETNEVATATTTCLDQDVFSTDRVSIIDSHPDSFKVSVRKIGTGALNAAAVEQCVFAHTGFRTAVVQETP